MYKTIIVPVDCAQLDKGEKILRQAATLLDEGGEIIVISVVEDMPGYIAIDLPVDVIEGTVRDARAKLTELKQKTNIDAKLEIRSGAAAREILAAAQEHQADLIIIASHVPDFSNYLIGATADRVVRHAKCSVLVDR
ncbi:universal stress protein [Peteryoungia desertarenae]|uniref:Universal stress protein n=1 Tax=Peteryoungia desertarenae TaxID=1813451 RepID=A0ABX6QLY9_9HYPH|nr:universal stress protein [Peteryoungia desertarenae]QLF69574.1 universal stress protein [Peteryoungia desertarenae]